MNNYILIVDTVDSYFIQDILKVLHPGDTLEVFKDNLIAYGKMHNTNYDMLLSNNIQLYKAFLTVQEHFQDCMPMYNTCINIQKEILSLFIQDDCYSLLVFSLLCLSVIIRFPSF